MSRVITPRRAGAPPTWRRRIPAPKVTSREELWRAAIKLPMYTVAVTPGLVGTAAAMYESGSVKVLPAVSFLVSAILIIAWLNLANDAFDHGTGIDRNKRESVVNLLGGTVRARRGVLVLAHSFLIAAFLLMRLLATTAPSGRAVMALLAVCVAMGHSYQGPPFRLGYLGLGEPICVIAFGIGVGAAFVAQFNHEISVIDAFKLFADFDSALPAAALLVGVLTTLILLCSHFHQGDDDLRAGKLSPIVRLGTRRAALLVRLVASQFLFAHFLLWYFGALPSECAQFGFLASLRSVFRLRGFIRDYHDKPEVVRSAKYIVVVLHFQHGVALSLAYAYAAWRRYGDELTISFI